MSNVSSFPQKIARSNASDIQRALSDTAGGVDNGGGPPHNGDMEARVSKLEGIAETTRDKITAVESRLQTIELTAASKDDLAKAKEDILNAISKLTTDVQSNKTDMHKEMHNLTWRIIGVLALVVAATIAVTKYLK